MFFSCQQFIDGDCRVTWSIVVVQHPSAFNAWSHTCHLFLSLSRTSRQKVWLTVCPGGTNSLWTILWLSKKINKHRFYFGFAYSRSLGTGRVCSVPLPTLTFCLGVVLQILDSSPVITRLKNSGSLSRRSRRSRHTYLRLAFCSVVRSFGTILAHTFLMSKSGVKIWWTVNRFKFNSLLIIFNVNRRSDLTRDLTLFTLSSVFEVEGPPARGPSSTCFRPYKKDLCHLNTCALDRECSL